MLKSKCTKAIYKLSGFMTAMAANIEVNVVPMLAPRVIGNILCTGSTPTPQSGVGVEVVTELDCTINVMPRPTKIAT